MLHLRNIAICFMLGWFIASLVQFIGWAWAGYIICALIALGAAFLVWVLCQANTVRERMDEEGEL